MTNDTTYVIAWSGGCDSTYMLDWAMKKYGTVDKPIIAVSCDHECLASKKSKTEKKARERIKKKFFVDAPIKFREVSTSTNFTSDDDNDETGHHQMNMWLGSVMPYLPSKSTLMLGYVAGDQVWHNIAHLRDVYRSLSQISNLQDFGVHFPLEWMTKEDIIVELKELGMYEYVWWCEDPKAIGKACGECVPCKTHDTALYNLKRDKRL